MKDRIVDVIFVIVVGAIVALVALGAAGFWDPVPTPYHEWRVPGTDNCWRTPLNADVPCG